MIIPGGAWFLWIAIVSSAIMLIAYEIWNLIVVSKDLATLSSAAMEDEPS